MPPKEAKKATPKRRCTTRARCVVDPSFGKVPRSMTSKIPPKCPLLHVNVHVKKLQSKTKGSAHTLSLSHRCGCVHRCSMGAQSLILGGACPMHFQNTGN